MNFHSRLFNVQYVHFNNNRKVNYQVSLGNTDITGYISSSLCMCVFFPSLMSTPDLSCCLPLARLLLVSSAQNNISKVRSPKGSGQACILL